MTSRPADDNPTVRYARWRKACVCLTTATTGRIVFGPGRDEGSSFILPITFHPGPVCDGCDTPWVRDAE